MIDLPPPILALDQISYHVGGKAILEDVSLSLYPGEIVCVVGSSGAGKSTLLRIAAGLVTPTSGNLSTHYDGRKIAAFHELAEPQQIEIRRRLFGFVSQNARDTLNMKQSAAANIVQPLFENGDRGFGRALTTAQFWFDALDLDRDRMSERPGTFSGGMQQRVQIAKALAPRPSILFLDEPTNGLDTAVQVVLLELLMQLQRDTGVTILLVTHDLRIARLLAHRLIVIEQGQIVEEATPDRLIVDPQHAASRALVSAMI